MIIEKTNPNQMVLEVFASNSDGSEKTNIVTANVRVYHVAGGVEIEDLASTAMSQVGSTNIWRYVWKPANLSANKYTAEYTLVDSGSLTATSGEDIVVGYLESKIDTISTNVNTIKEIETGRWKIVNNQLLLYGSDNTTLIATFNLFDSSGLPTSENPMDRVKV